MSKSYNGSCSRLYRRKFLTIVNALLPPAAKRSVQRDRRAELLRTDGRRHERSTEEPILGGQHFQI